MCDSENKGSSPRAVGREPVWGRAPRRRPKQEAQRALGPEGNRKEEAAPRKVRPRHTQAL